MTPNSDPIPELFQQALEQITHSHYQAARCLPADFYVSNQWLEFELEHLFRKQWICVGRMEELRHRGDYLTITIANEPVLVCRSNDGRLRAFSNVCRHRGTTVMEGSGNADRFICPYHHWTYDTFGELVSAPLMRSQKHFNLKKCNLQEVRCEQWMGFVFVNLDSGAKSLKPGLQPARDLVKNYHVESMYLKYVSTETWGTNWKSLMENYMEGYHLSPLHKTTLHKLNPTRLCEPIPPGDNHFGYRVGFSQRLPADQRGHRDLNPEEMSSCVMLALPPSLGIGIGSDYSSFVCLYPMSTAEVTIKTGLVFHGRQWSESEIDEAVGLFELTMAEDRQVLRRVHAGLQSNYHQAGPLAPRDYEGTIWDFYQYLARQLLPVLS